MEIQPSAITTLKHQSRFDITMSYDEWEKAKRLRDITINTNFEGESPDA